MVVIILPGLGNSGPDHWQSHWQRANPSFERLLQDEWDAPSCSDWIERLDHRIQACTHRVVLAAHSSACALVAHWAAGASATQTARVAGALMVAPTDPDGVNYPKGPTGFGPMPMQALPFKSIVVASQNDTYIQPERARQYARAWGSEWVLLHNAGHINAASGFGPWPEGLELLASLCSVARGVLR